MSRSSPASRLSRAWHLPALLLVLVGGSLALLVWAQSAEPGATARWPVALGLSLLAALLALGLLGRQLAAAQARLAEQDERARSAEPLQQQLDELQHERLRLERILEGTHLGSWEWEVQSGALRLDRRWAEIVGHSLEELSPPSIAVWQGLCHPDDLARSQRLLQEHFDGSSPAYECEMRMRHKAGHWIWVLDRGKLFSRDAQGRPQWMAGTQADITERKRAELELNKLSLALEQSPATIIMTDVEGHIEYVNEAFSRISGYSAQEALGQRPALLASGLTPATTYTELWTALSEGRRWKGELTNRRKDGSVYTDLCSIHPLRQSDGSVSHYVSVQEDISEKRAMREELAQYRHHLEELVRQRTAELSEAKRQAEVASQSKSVFLANMSHEIRTPMNAILGLTHLIEQNLGQQSTQPERRHALPQLRDRAKKIEQAAKHLLTILNDVLDLSKIEAGKLQIEVTDFDLRELVDGAVYLVSERAQANGTRIHTDIELVPQRLSGDGMRLGQILLNYLSNAVKFTERGEVRLSARRVSTAQQPLRLRFEVRDSGVGLSEEQCTRLFRVFEQAETSTTRRFGGTGLGLAIVQRLAELMQGEVGVSSHPGRGSTFWFEGPFAQADGAARVEQAGLLPADAVLAALRERRGQLLLVEDTPVNQEIALEMLRHAGLSVDVAANGRRAVQMAAERRYDLILMDLRMPLMDGFEATGAIRNIPQHLRTPILAMTANAFAEDRAAALAAGMNDHIGKPVLPELLYAMLLKWLPQPASATRRATPAPAPAPEPLPADASANAELRAALAAVPGLQLETGLAALGGKLPKLVALLGSFAARHAQAAAQIAEAASQGDWREATRLAHTLRGAGASLGLHEISRCALTAETELERQRLPDLVPLRQALDAACPALQALAEAGG